MLHPVALCPGARFCNDYFPDSLQKVFLWLSHPLPCFSLCYNQPHLANVTGMTSVLLFEGMWHRHVAVETDEGRKTVVVTKYGPGALPLSHLRVLLSHFVCKLEASCAAELARTRHMCWNWLRMQEAEKQVDFIFLVSLVVSYLLWYGSQPLGNLVIFRASCFWYNFHTESCAVHLKRRRKKSTVIITSPLFFVLSLIVTVPR